MKLSEIFQIETSHAAGNLAAILGVIAESGLVLEHVSAIRRDQHHTLWELTVELEESARESLVARLNALPATRFIGWSDRLFERHRGGKIEVRSRMAISSQQILRDLYIPGAAGVCQAIRAAPEKALEYSWLGRVVAVVSDGSAVTGLGARGLRSRMPVLEGYAAVLSDLVGISAVPILVESASVESFVDAVSAIAPSFGALLLTEIGAPRCFEIEQKLRARLRSPVLHIEQHSTAAVTLAALLNASRQTGRALGSLTVGVVGLGAVGLGVARLVHAHGVGQLLGNDLRTDAMGRLAQLRGQRETLERLLARSDVVICATGQAGLIDPERIRKGQIVLALSRPDPEIEPAMALAAGASVAADGKSIMDVLCFPGLSDAVLRCRAPGFSDAMLVAAAHAIAQAAQPGRLLPDPLDASLHQRVSQAAQAVIGGAPAPPAQGTPATAAQGP